MARIRFLSIIFVALIVLAVRLTWSFWRRKEPALAEDFEDFDFNVEFQAEDLRPAAFLGSSLPI
jgi:hypothetical protein